MKTNINAPTGVLSSAFVSSSTEVVSYFNNLSSNINSYLSSSIYGQLETYRLYEKLNENIPSNVNVSIIINGDQSEAYVLLSAVNKEALTSFFDIPRADEHINFDSENHAKYYRISSTSPETIDGYTQIIFKGLDYKAFIGNEFQSTPSGFTTLYFQIPDICIINPQKTSDAELRSLLIDPEDKPGLSSCIYINKLFYPKEEGYKILTGSITSSDISQTETAGSIKTIDLTKVSGEVTFNYNNTPSDYYYTLTGDPFKSILDDDKFSKAYETHHHDISNLSTYIDDYNSIDTIVFDRSVDGNLQYLLTLSSSFKLCSSLQKEYETVDEFKKEKYWKIKDNNDAIYTFNEYLREIQPNLLNALIDYSDIISHGQTFPDKNNIAVISYDALSSELSQKTTTVTDKEIQKVDFRNALYNFYENNYLDLSKSCFSQKYSNIDIYYNKLGAVAHIYINNLLLSDEINNEDGSGSYTIVYSKNDLNKTPLYWGHMPLTEVSQIDINLSLNDNNIEYSGYSINDLTLYYDRELTSSLIVNKFGKNRWFPSNSNKPVFEEEVSYDLENFYDWYDIQDYKVKYSDINSDIINSDSIELVLSNNNVTYDAHSIILSGQSISISSNIRTNAISLGTSVNYTPLLYEYDPGYILSSETNNNEMRYKALSFNFMIPEDAWADLDNELYEQNPNFGKRIYTSPADITKETIYHGALSAIWRNLKSGSLTEAGTDLPISDCYTVSSVTIPYYVRVTNSDRNSDKEKLFSVVSPLCPSLNFNDYLYEAPSTNSNIKHYNKMRHLKYLAIPITLNDGSKSVVQLNDIDMSIDLSGMNLVMSIAEPLSAGVTQSLMSSSYTDLINEQIINLPTESFVSAIFRNSRTELSEMVEYTEICNILEKFGLRDNSYIDPTLFADISGEITGYLTGDLSNYRLHTQVIGSTMIDNTIIDLSGYSRLGGSGVDKYVKINLLSGVKTPSTYYYLPVFWHKAGCEIGPNTWKSISGTIINDNTTNNQLKDSVLVSHVGSKEVYDHEVDAPDYMAFYSRYSNNRTYGLITFKLSDETSMSTDKSYSSKQIFPYRGDFSKSSLQSYFNNIANTTSYYDAIAEKTFTGKVRYRISSQAYATTIADGVQYVDFEDYGIPYRCGISPNVYVHERTDQYLHLILIGTLTRNGKNVSNSSYKSTINGRIKQIEEKIKQLVPEKIRSLNGGLYAYSSIDFRSSGSHGCPSELKISYGYNQRTLFKITYKLSSGTSTKTNTSLLLEVKKNNASLEKADYKGLGNIIHNATDGMGRWINWMSIYDVRFVLLDPTESNNTIKYGTLGFRESISDWKSQSLYSSITYLPIFDKSKFVSPFDISTNLLYLSGSTEQIAINAKKMYEVMDPMEDQPAEEYLQYGFDQFFDKEMVLTGFIPSGAVESLYFYRNDKYIYGTTTDPNYGTNNKLHKVKYTDFREKSKIYDVMRIKSSNSCMFTSINDIYLDVDPMIGDLDSPDLRARMKVPVKIQMSFEDLCMRKQVKYGIKYDDSSRFTFDKTIFAIDKDEAGRCIEDWEALKLGNPDIILDRYLQYTAEKADDATGVSGIQRYVLDFDDNIYDPQYQFGGARYYNDALRMSSVGSYVSEWTDFNGEDYQIMYDYSPRINGNRIIGTPYLNLSGIIPIKVNGGGENENEIDHYLVKAPVMKIAEDGDYEYANVKPIAPKIRTFKVELADSLASYVESDGFAPYDNQKWQKMICIDDNNIGYTDRINQPFFSMLFNTNDNPIESEVNPVKNENNSIIGYMVKIKLNGLKKFKECGYRYYFNNAVDVKLASEEMVKNYLDLGRFMENGYEIDGFNKYARIGDVVQSGYITCEPNYLKFEKFDNTKNCGRAKYRWNSPTRKKFQLEVIKKSNTNITRDLYYVNLPMGPWYNMTLYNIISGENEQSASKTSKIGLQLTQITGDSYEDLPTTPTEVFSLYTSDEGILQGLSEYNSAPPYGELTDDFDSTKTEYDIYEKYNLNLDPCYRNVFTPHFSTEASALFMADDLSQDDLANRPDLLLLGDIFKSFNLTTNVKISLFNNTGDIFNSFTEASSAKDKYIPYEVSSIDNRRAYKFKVKDYRYHIKAIPGTRVNSIMWISTPNLSKYSSTVKYYDTYAASLTKLKEYVKMFGNMQYKLAPMTLSRQIGNSNYATMVWNSCENVSKSKNIKTVDNESAQNFFVNDYSNDPLSIAYVWNNSQVTRNETCEIDEDTGMLSASPSHLYWTESSEKESLYEVGSMYNFADVDSIASFVNREIASINNRQLVQWPSSLKSIPISYHKKSNDEGIVTANEKIITTAALGYNENGYPMNSIMVYNGSESIKIDNNYTTYLYIAQNDTKNDCVFGATQEKPIYVDIVNTNVAAASENLKFLQDFAVKSNFYDSDPLTMNYLSITKETTTNNTTITKEGFLSGVGDGDLTLGSFSPSSFQTSIFDYSNKTIISKSIDVTYYGNALAENINADIVPYRVFSESDNDCWKSMNCFSIEGELKTFNRIPNNNELSSILGAAYNNGNDIHEGLRNLLDPANKFEKAPEIAIIWSNTAPAGNYDDYCNLVKNPVSNEVLTVVYDEYQSVNISSIKFTIKNNHLDHAPVRIRFKFLNVVRKSDNDNACKLAWQESSSFTFEVSNPDSEYDKSKVVGSKTFVHSFVPITDEDQNMIRNVFGIAIIVDKIVKQTADYQPCIIDGITLYASNLLNEYGQAFSVEDVYVRKADANCRNFYNMNVKEYAWHIPSASEWNNLFENAFAHNNETNFIASDILAKINGSETLKTNLIDGGKTDILDENVSDYIASGRFDGFSLLNTMYVTSANERSVMTDVISDNYLSENEDMRITWKYVDYVYIYYNTFSTHARYLLEKNYGNAIFNAVKEKLEANRKSLNYNSAFADKFEFSGGITIDKREDIPIIEDSTVFEWTSSDQIKNDWTDVHTIVQTDTYGTKVVTTTGDVLKTKYVNGKANSSKSVGTWSETTRSLELIDSTKEEFIEAELRAQTYLYNASMSKVEHKTVAMNPKYKDAASWLNSYSPVMIHYVIQ